MKMEQDELQSYFKSLCDSFYIADQQEDRLDKEKRKKECDEDLEMIDFLLYCTIAKEVQNKYISLKYSRKELRKERKRLEKIQQEYNVLSNKCSMWGRKKYRTLDEIVKIVTEIRNRNYSVIITSEAELHALIYFYATHSVREYPIINVDEQCMKDFPKENAMYTDFLAAYGDDLEFGTRKMHDLFLQYL